MLGTGFYSAFSWPAPSPPMAEVVEQGVEEMAEGDVALANQAAREQWCAALRDWLLEQEVAA